MKITCNKSVDCVVDYNQKQGSRNRGGGGGGPLAPPTFVKGGPPPQYLSRIAVAIYTPKIHQESQTT